MRFLTLACCLSLSTWAAAQDTTGLSEYQQGAGAYFAGRTDQAEEHLTAAIQSDPNDIRAYYLRGLNRLNAGDMKGAQVDLAKGAELEAQHGSSPYVDQSLSSVQGSARLTLERIRRAARRSAELEARRATMKARKQHREEMEKRVLRTDYQLPIEALASRLTVEQARQVAVKGQQAPASAVAATSAAPPQAEIESDRDNPFADDTYDEGQTFAATDTTSSDVATPADDVDVPESARGSVEARTLFGIMGKVIGQAVKDRAGAVTGAIPPMGPMGPAGPPPGMPGGGMDGFGEPGGGMDGFGEPGGMDGFSAPQPGGGEDSFGEPADGNPFEDEPAVESPFDFGE